MFDDHIKRHELVVFLRLSSRLEAQQAFKVSDHGLYRLAEIGLKSLVRAKLDMLDQFTADELDETLSRVFRGVEFDWNDTELDGACDIVRDGKIERSLDHALFV